MIGNRYQLRADVGLGTFGRVVECWDVKRCRRVAVKSFVRRVHVYFIARVRIHSSGIRYFSSIGVCTHMKP